MKPHLLVIVMILLACIVEGGQQLINTRAPAFDRYDQYNRYYNLQSFASRPILLLASDKEGEEQNY